MDVSKSSVAAEVSSKAAAYFFKHPAATATPSEPSKKRARVGFVASAPKHTKFNIVT